ncbi:MAG: tyrosine-type recombinase/integrase [Ruminiclostridium sp.]|nr:tyrosine-type recombinase/integrase [Ruminiclostridium sp.]
MPMVALHWEHYFQHIRAKYNAHYKEPLPIITPHVCRHTFCSKMARAGMNPKCLQYIMGHSEIAVTMNTYTHLTFDDAKKDMKKVLAEASMA